MRLHRAGLYAGLCGAGAEALPSGGSSGAGTGAAPAALGRSGTRGAVRCRRGAGCEAQFGAEGMRADLERSRGGAGRGHCRRSWLEGNSGVYS